MQIGWTVFGVIACCGGAFCLYHAGATLWKRRSVRREAKRAKGKLIELRHCKSASDEPDFYTPIVRFSDHHGRTHEISLLVTSDPKKFTIGSSVEVIYEASNPKNFIHAGSTSQEYIIVLIGLLLALGMFVVGLLALFGQIEIVTLKPKA